MIVILIEPHIRFGGEKPFSFNGTADVSKLRNAVIKEGQDKQDLFVSFENRNIKPSKVMGHPLANNPESKEGVYRRYMNNSSS